MTDITLYEKVNKEKLNEVINCDNIPFENKDNNEWKDKFLTRLVQYSKKKYTKYGFQVKYSQIFKYGRYYAQKGLGLQAFQKEVRKYISGEYYDDIDIVNCHPYILNQLLKKYSKYGVSLLDEYCKDRDKILNEQNLTKTDVIKMINNSDNCNHIFFKNIHEQIYKELVPILKKENKALYDRIKKQRNKDKKPYNIEGSFLSHYLQNIENDILMVIYNYLNEKGYIVGALMFDGLIVEKTDTIKDELKIMQELIKEKTSYDVLLTMKSTKTKWKPRIVEKVNLEEEIHNNNTTYSVEYARSLYIQCSYFDLASNERVYDDLKIKQFFEYLNNFICKINKPHAYGWRHNINEPYEMRTSSQVLDRIRVGFENIKDYNLSWKDSDMALMYDKFDFCVDESKVNENNYNLYKRPCMLEHDFKNIDEVSPLFHDFLLNVISNKDVSVYNYIIHYLSKMVQVGKTGQLLVLRGEKGTGKSSFTDICRMIIGDKYFQKIDDITHIGGRFNGMYETTILTVVEEIVSNASEYHSIQSKLKTLTTEEYIRIERKGVDAYMSKSCNNFILCTNEFNPVKITKDNRRNMIIQVPNTRQNNVIYFKNLKKEINEKIKEIRYFFYKYKFEDDLNSIRPFTEAEQEVLELNETPATSFIKSYNFGKGYCDNRLFKIVYENYKEYCKTNNFKVVSSKYFSQELKSNGFNTKKYGKFNKTYVIGKEDEYSNDDNDDNISYEEDTF